MKSRTAFLIQFTFMLAAGLIVMDLYKQYPSAITLKPLIFSVVGYVMVSIGVFLYVWGNLGPGTPIDLFELPQGRNLICTDSFPYNPHPHIKSHRGKYLNVVIDGHVCRIVVSEQPLTGIFMMSGKQIVLISPPPSQVSAIC